ncbi:hypothetical protein [Chryseobacterium arthrosphaerae]|uniref:hypothetical protein n=1 Tax=Chryseobacterium arthrosphaerae TaxID=651561 RepID=UPI001F4B0E03|nr:hypothetical protein [Chryseobacterium arthrosphaerae]
MIKLINVIEISPLLYAKDDYELPETSDDPDPEEWFSRWEEAASQLNFNFKIIEKGSYLADIETIDDENLQMILEERLKEFEKNSEEEDLVLAFDGGVALEKNSTIYIKPTCCSDMSDLKNWQDIFTNPSEEWIMMWIGHPWVLYRKENGKISFSEYTESGEIDPGNIKTLVEVEESELKAEFEKVLQRQADFKNRISGLLKKTSIKNKERIAELLTGTD